MSLHSSYHDYMGYQVSNIFFDDLRKTPPQRLKFFFVPELDYNGYVHVVRDQEERKFKKDYRRNQLSACRQELLQKHRTRQARREQFESSIKPSKKGSSPPPPKLEGQEKRKPQRTGLQRWADQRKKENDAKAVSMIEARMQQEATEQQLYEGWRSAAQASIRNKFRETALINRQVDQQLFLPHTRKHPERSQTSLGFTQDSSLGRTMHSESTWDAAPMSPESTAMSPIMSPADVSEADRQVAELSVAPEDQPGANQSTSAASQRRSAASKAELEREQEVGDFEHDVQAFDSSISNRQVLTSQRLRSLSLESTKHWTTPARAESSCQ